MRLKNVIKKSILVWLFAATVAIVVSFSVSFVLIETLQIPPGCLSKYLKLDTIGGCFGKNLVKNLKIEPELPKCIKIVPYECTGAGLMVYNKCNKDLVIHGEKISKGYTYLLFVRARNGSVMRIKERYYYPYPKENEFIFVEGRIGGKEFNISYIRTKALC